MLKIKFFATFALLGLAACQPQNGNVEPANNGTIASGPEACGLAAGTLVDERTLYAAETAYNVPAHAYVALDGQGKLSADVKARTRPLLVDAYRHLQTARAAYKIGDVCELATAAAAARNLAENAKTYLPSN